MHWIKVTGPTGLLRRAQICVWRSNPLYSLMYLNIYVSGPYPVFSYIYKFVVFQVLVLTKFVRPNNGSLSKLQNNLDR